jgi:hypothetical protein
MHRFSIIIPTRDREDTLRATLKTCLVQEFDDFEILLVDNSVRTDTKQLIDELNSPRIRYVRPPQPLAMTDNWEYAVEQSDGEYLTIIGSDDGLMLHTLPELDRIIREFDAKVLRWAPVCYNWPGLPEQNRVIANDLLIPLRQRDYCHPIHLRESRPMIRAAANSEISYTELPSIYCSAIHRSVVETVRASGGRVFKSECPDVYSSFAFAWVAGRFHSLDAPLSINGLSSTSNGVGVLYAKQKSSEAEDFQTLNAAASHTRHPETPDLPLMPALVADSFLHAKETYFPNDPELTIDRWELVKHCIDELDLSSEGEWDFVREAIGRSLGNEDALRRRFEETYPRSAFEAVKGGAKRPALKRYGQHHLRLDASEFGVADVFDAALLCERLLGYKKDHIVCALRSEGEPEVLMASHAAKLTAKLREERRKKEKLREQLAEAKEKLKAAREPRRPSWQRALGRFLGGSGNYGKP